MERIFRLKITFIFLRLYQLMGRGKVVNRQLMNFLKIQTEISQINKSRVIFK